MTLLLQILGVVILVVLQPATVALVRRLWPIRQSERQRLKEHELRAQYGRAFDGLSDAVAVLGLLGLVVVPMLAYQAIKLLALFRCQCTPALFLFFGFTPLAFPLLLAGYLFGVASGPVWIRLLYRGEKRAALLYLYSIGEHREGQLNRLLVRRASRVALGLALIPLFLWGNRYTLIGAEGIEVPRPAGWWSRQTIAKDRVLAASRSESDKGRLSLCLVLRDGTHLDNVSGGNGLLDGYGRSGQRVLEILKSDWKVPIVSAPGDPSLLCLRAGALAEQQIDQRRVK
jgi:hypothetical protein